MKHILPAIDSLDQHLFHLDQQPDAYRPEQCPHCGKKEMWRHGCYHRKVDRIGSDGEYCDPLPIPRYYCACCQRTCSRLPRCLPPRRWYLWAVQQVVLAALLLGSSIRKVAISYRLSRHTVRRWRRWLEDRFVPHSFHLRNRFPELGRHSSVRAFWLACFGEMPLAEAMAWLDRDGVVIP